MTPEIKAWLLATRTRMATVAAELSLTETAEEARAAQFEEQRRFYQEVLSDYEAFWSESSRMKPLLALGKAANGKPCFKPSDDDVRQNIAREAESFKDLDPGVARWMSSVFCNAEKLQQAYADNIADEVDPNPNPNDWLLDFSRMLLDCQVTSATADSGARNTKVSCVVPT